MPRDLFISYSRRDNERGQVATLAEQMRSAFHAFAGRELQIFFDDREIHGMDDWRHKIQRSLRESRLFLAVLSPNYLVSPYCRWEWEDYVRYEAMRQCLGEGVAPVFFVSLPDAANPLTDPATKRWIGEINQRQTFDLRPWHDDGEKALQQTHVRETLEKLEKSVRERLDRAERARRSPANLLRHNPWFVGRVRELTELRNALAKNKLGVVGARQSGVMATVQGVGGMGKTELALAYAHAFAWDYPGGRWQLRCERVTDLRVALLQLAGPMGFEFTDDENKNLSLAFDRVLREMNHRERCLLVLDNVSDPGILEPEYLDRLPRDGHVDLIATTRLAPASIPGSAQDQTFIAVDELPEEDALSLLRSHQPDGRFPDQGEDDEARAIARLLEGFTLAIETAAIYLGRHAGPDACRTFRARLQASLLGESEKAAGDPTVAVRHHERLLGKTLAFTFETMSQEAIDLLTLASLLPPDTIALPWLQAVGTSTFRTLHEDHSGPDSVFDRTVDLLLGLRLLQTTGESDAEGHLLVARMHRLIQEYVKSEHQAEAAGLEPALLKHIKSRASFLWKGWVSHGHRWELGPLVACAWRWLEIGNADGAYLAYQASGPLKHLGKFAEAELLSRRALEIDERLYGHDHSIVAADQVNLASILDLTNSSFEAYRLYCKALASDEEGSGEDDPGFACTLSNLATFLRSNDRPGEAEPLYRRALEIDERLYGPDHPEVATDLNNLAALLSGVGRLDQAEPLYRRALEIREASPAPESTLVGPVLNNLAELLLKRGRPGEAEPLYRRALEIDERLYGPDHPEVATDLNNLAVLLWHVDRPDEAEPLCRRALKILEASLGPAHPDLAPVLENLALLLRSNDRLDEAEPLRLRAEEIRSQENEKQLYLRLMPSHDRSVYQTFEDYEC